MYKIVITTSHKILTIKALRDHLKLDLLGARHALEDGMVTTTPEMLIDLLMNAVEPYVRNIASTTASAWSVPFQFKFSVEQVPGNIPLMINYRTLSAWKEEHNKARRAECFDDKPSTTRLAR